MIRQFVLVSAFASSPAFSQPVDKAAHFGVSFAAVISCHAILKTATEFSLFARHSLCAVSTMSIGLGKEISDSKKSGQFGKVDLAADAMGTLGGSAAILLYDLHHIPPDALKTGPGH